MVDNDGVSRLPGNKAFAFTIFDDTDASTVQNTAPVYRLLTDLGFRVTKSVWPLAADPSRPYQGGSLEDANYVDFIRSLRADGHEIALHNVRNSDSTRDVVKHGLARFEDAIGQPPRLHANHSLNRDNLYWGAERLRTRAARLSYEVAARFYRRYVAEGHREDSPYFWGDLCQERIVYVRNFVFGAINLDPVDPSMPYHDPSKPYVKYWFSSCEGGNPRRFCEMLSEANQDRLEAERGVCIMYAHLARGFYNGQLHPRFETLMRRLARKDGWFVPVSELLDHLRHRRGGSISVGELARLEGRWLRHKLRIGPS